MKTIIIAIFILFAGFVTKAQVSNEKNNESSADIAAQKAQTGDPLVNGMPYSQWKIKVATEKAAQDQKDNALQADAAKQGALLKRKPGANNASNKAIDYSLAGMTPSAGKQTASTDNIQAVQKKLAPLHSTKAEMKARIAKAKSKKKPTAE